MKLRMIVIEADDVSAAEVADVVAKIVRGSSAAVLPMPTGPTDRPALPAAQLPTAGAGGTGETPVLSAALTPRRKREETKPRARQGRKPGRGTPLKLEPSTARTPPRGEATGDGSTATKRRRLRCRECNEIAPAGTFHRAKCPACGKGPSWDKLADEQEPPPQKRVRHASGDGALPINPRLVSASEPTGDARGKIFRVTAED